MALMITDECISCGVCLPECPNEAIVEDDGVFRIRGGRCTECAGFFDEPKCRELCPVSECIVPRCSRRRQRDRGPTSCSERAGRPAFLHLWKS